MKSCKNRKNESLMGGGTLLREAFLDSTKAKTGIKMHFPSYY